MHEPRTNSKHASNQTVYNGRNTSSGEALACWFFICTNLKQTMFKPQVYGAGPCHQVQPDLKESSINFFFALGNCRFPPLPRIEVWLGFVHMKKQQIEGVLMAWLSPIECGAQRCFQSMSGVCTYENTAHRRCHQESAHPSMKWAACRHQQGLFEVCTYENTAEGRGTKRCKQTDG